jgi:hypothetical protein
MYAIIAYNVTSFVFSHSRIEIYVALVEYLIN